MPVNSRRPMNRVRMPNCAMTVSASAATIMLAVSRRSSLGLTAIGAMSAAVPRTPRMLKVLLPTMLPMAMSERPSIAAPRLTTSSGADVQNATTVIPMSSGEILNLLATASAPRTSHSAPPKSRTNPPNAYAYIITRRSLQDA
jgi:hypothetical protein